MLAITRAVDTRESLKYKPNMRPERKRLRAPESRLWRTTRPFTAIMFLTLLPVASPLYAQRFPTNEVSQAKAMLVATRLWVGMKEEDVAKVVDKENGLKSGGSAGDSIGWTRFYLLSNGCFLDLQMEPKEVVTNGRWGGNGLLKSASIQSNGVKILSITLTNAPAGLYRRP